MVILDINIAYLATAKIGPCKIIKILPSTKMNQREMW